MKFWSWRFPIKLGFAYYEFGYKEFPNTKSRFLYNKPIDSNAKNFGCNESPLHLYTRCKRDLMFNEILLAKTKRVDNNKHDLLTSWTLHINVVAPQDTTLNARNRSSTILHTRACYSNYVCSFINLFLFTLSSVFCKIYTCTLQSCNYHKIKALSISYRNVVSKRTELFLFSSADFNICINATVHEFIRAA